MAITETVFSTVGYNKLHILVRVLGLRSKYLNLLGI